MSLVYVNIIGHIAEMRKKAGAYENSGFLALAVACWLEVDVKKKSLV